MDEIDRKIILKLLEDGRTSYRELGETIRYTIMGAKEELKKCFLKD